MNQITGIKKGKTIELLEEINIPDGQKIIITIEKIEETIPEKRTWSPHFFEQTWGAWQGEPLVREPQPEYQEREELL